MNSDEDSTKSEDIDGWSPTWSLWRNPGLLLVSVSGLVSGMGVNSDGDGSLETSYTHFRNQHIDQEKQVDVILQHHIPVKVSLNWPQAKSSLLWREMKGHLPKGQHFLHVRYTTGMCSRIGLLANVE